MSKLLAATLLALCSSCLIGGGTRTVTSLELRAAVAGYNLGAVDPSLRDALAHGAIWEGATETELYLSRGTPHLWWNTSVNGSACRVFVHHGADPALADIAVTACNGRVIGTNQIEPALPCWRLAEVGPRIAQAAQYFDSRPLDVQWQIVIGLLHRGQAEQDVRLAFGEPHSRGFDEREDGKRAEKIVFLDRSGDAYGLDVTLINNAVVGWQMPATRVLTPEAQQRRLDAMEKRLDNRIAELEAKQTAQHAETVKLFNTVMSRQDAMMAQLTQPPTPPPPAPRNAMMPTSAAPPPTAVALRRQSSEVRVETDRQPSSRGALQPPMGKCICKGWPIGTDVKTAQQKHEKCMPNIESTSQSQDWCNSACQAGGFGVGLYLAPATCE